MKNSKKQNVAIVAKIWKNNKIELYAKLRKLLNVCNNYSIFKNHKITKSIIHL